MQEVVNRHGVSFHGFADGSQLSKHMFVNEIHAGKCTMIDCIADIELWCCSHGLKLNTDKSDVICPVRALGAVVFVRIDPIRFLLDVVRGD